MFDLLAEVTDKSTQISVVLDKHINDFIPGVETLMRNNPLVAALLVLMCLDIVTGLLAAWAGGVISSSTSFKGICRKGIMIGLVATAKVMEFVIPGAPLAQIGALGFCCTELFSIVENAGKAGVPLPVGLKSAFEKFKEKKDDGKTNVVEINLEKGDTLTESVRIKRPSDMIVNIRDSGEIEPPGKTDKGNPL